MALIVAVGDGAGIREVLEELLQEEGYQTAGAADGRAGLSQL
jgi:CheY-like chemotaxis protein